MNKYLISALLLSTTAAVQAADPVTMADMSAEAQERMYSIITEYNSCMMKNRLQEDLVVLDDPRQTAENIMNSCESHLETFRGHLADNQLEPALVDGMEKKMRSRAARHLMTMTMNNYAAQASALVNAEKMQQSHDAE